MNFGLLFVKRIYVLTQILGIVIVPCFVASFLVIHEGRESRASSCKVNQHGEKTLAGYT